MLPVSVCIIAKNEENFIEDCLKSLIPFDWEIIVADTGSTDQTVEIAKRYTEHVFHFTWTQDFSAARNFCISHASRKWILSIDCDEFLTGSLSQAAMEDLLAPVFRQPEQAGMLCIINPQGNPSGSTSEEPVARLFHRDFYQYQGKIHEQPMSIQGDTPAYQPVPLSLYHAGYADASILQKKASRNILLLNQSLEHNPADAYLLFQLGQSYFVMGNYEEALKVFEKGLAVDVNPELQYVQTMVESYGYCLIHLKRYRQALQLEGVYDVFCHHADFLFLMGLIYMNNAMFEQAVSEFLKASQTEKHTVAGVNSYLSYYNIGVIYECLGEKEKARNYYLKCGAYAPAVRALEG